MAIELSFLLDKGMDFDSNSLLEGFLKSIQASGRNFVDSRAEINEAPVKTYDDFFKLHKDGQSWLLAHHDTDGNFYSISFSEFGFICSAYLRKGWDDQQILQFREALMAVIYDANLEIKISTIADTRLENSFMRKKQIPYYFVGNYSKFFKVFATKELVSEQYNWEDFVNIPAFKKEVHENWMEFQVYDRLFDVEAEDQLTQIRKVACFLEKHCFSARDGLQRSPQLYEGGDSRPWCANCE